MEEKAPEGASATGTQGASSAQGASAQGIGPGIIPAGEVGGPAAQPVTLPDVSYGWHRSADGKLVMKKGWTEKPHWLWLMEHRDQIMNKHDIPLHGVLMGATQ